MKRALLISGALLALSASIASAAGGINLAWDDCYGAGGATHRNFACNTNAGNNDLYVSFEPPVEIYGLAGSNQWLDLQSASTTLPQWWQLKNAGTCRQSSLTAITALTATCPDAWSGMGAPGIAQYTTNSVSPSMPPNRARILGSVGFPMWIGVSPGTEYFCILIRINNAKTVGLGSCAGCSEPVCIVLNEVLLSDATIGSDDVRLQNPLASNYATWQGGAVGGAGCPGVTPTTNRTWGQVKSIYR